MGVVDCLVLSGGGAKGAYGAGVAKALDAYRGLTKQDSSVCYAGTSAGALNAAVLAAADADALLRSGPPSFATNIGADALAFVSSTTRTANLQLFPTAYWIA